MFEPIKHTINPLYLPINQSTLWGQALNILIMKKAQTIDISKFIGSKNAWQSIIYCVHQ